MHCQIKTELTPGEAAKIGGFLAASPAASHRQSLIWPKLAPLTRLQHYRYLTCEQADELVLAAVVRFTLLFPGCYLAAMQRGPVFRELSALRRCMPSVKEVLREHGVVTMMVNPMWVDSGADVVSEELASCGFCEVPPESAYMYRVTGVVDLDRPEEEIFGGLKYRCRRHMRSAERQGLTVRAAKDDADVLRFKALFQEFSNMKEYDSSGQMDLVDQWRYVRENGGVFDLAEIDGQLIGGHVALGEGRRAVLSTLASLPVLPGLPRSYTLLWEAIRKLKAQGFHEFDLGGLDEAALGDKENRGREFFKLSFNPRIERLVPVHYLALRPLAHAVLFRGRQLYRRSRLVRSLGARLYVGGRAH